MNNKNTADLLSPAYQDAYWSRIDPDIRMFLDEFESRENWTYTYEELPEIFQQVSRALPKFSEFKINEQNSNEIQPILKKLIVILATMPLREAISAISWLDKSIESETEIGWGVAIYMEAAQVALHDKNDPFFAECSAIHERINLMLHSKLSAKLFMQLRSMGE